MRILQKAWLSVPDVRRSPRLARSRLVFRRRDAPDVGYMLFGLRRPRYEDNWINLCDTCGLRFAECDGIVKFGNGVGNDNVCECSSYEPVDTSGDERGVPDGDA